MHLRQILSAYAAYYNQARTHFTERCALASSRPTIWRHCRHSDPGWTAPPIRPDMIFGRDRSGNWLGRFFLAHRRLRLGSGGKRGVHGVAIAEAVDIRLEARDHFPLERLRQLVTRDLMLRALAKEVAHRRF